MDSKILIVDDDPLSSELLTRILEQLKNGYNFYKAINGKMGVEIAMEVLPDLILMDWEMPVMNGIDATIALKSNKSTSTIPIIILTGAKSSSENLKLALDAGASDFIRKPYDKFELQARVNSALTLSRSWKTIVEQQQQLLLQEKNILETELEYRNRQLINHSLFIAQNYQKTQKILDQVKKLYPYLNQTGNKQLEQIIKENSFDLEQSFWSEYEQQFDELYPGFFKNLQKMHPNLTQGEKKLCAYIRLNMSTKDIASIAHVDPHSINIARSRLRTKLKLDRDTNLFIYLSLIF
jgi:DNA-binding response OmpR family regulator/DNA-binding CsgD family transcriptional regulator